MTKLLLGISSLVLLCCGGADDQPRKRLRAGPPCLCRLWEIDPGLYVAEEHAVGTNCADPQSRLVYDTPELPPQLCEEDGCDDLSLRKTSPKHHRLKDPKEEDYQLKDFAGKYVKTRVGKTTKVVSFWVDDQPANKVLARVFVVEGDPKQPQHYRQVPIGFEIAAGMPDETYSEAESKSRVKNVVVDQGGTVLTYQFKVKMADGLVYHIVTKPR